ncbi:MAG: family 1 glycosylhydrolase [bacterium]|nr:family 1 glycosylhydrolase [bacterium]
MWRWVLYRLALFAFIVWGSILTIRFVIERNEVNSQPLPSPQSAPDKKEESTPKDITFEDVKFPDDFFFGTASSDFQTTGGNGLSDWKLYIDECVKSQIKCRDKNDPKSFVGPGTGTDFLNRYKEDFDLAGQFNDQVHRLSFEWARIEPEDGKLDKEAIKKYKDIILYMKSKGIEPMICLNHFTLPLWFAEKGGWESPEAAFYYSRYAQVIAKEIGLPLKVKWWLTFNEPQVMLLPYTKGNWPPNKPVKKIQDQEGVQRALRVVSNLIDTHRLAYRTLHSILGDKIMVSYASAPGPFYPHNPESPLDQIAYNISTALDTLGFDYAVGRTDRDFIGLNYYGRVKLTLHISFWDSVKRMSVPKAWLTQEKPFAIQWEMPIERKQGDRPKEFYPQALYDLIMKFKDFGLPIVITENGLSDSEDKFREEFLVIHLKAINDAMKDGVNIIGYQYWALTDTWEWDGVFSQMGLIGIDRENSLERKLRPSARTYGEIIKTHTIKKELLEKHKELLVDPN